jgi:hypothetical protein
MTVGDQPRQEVRQEIVGAAMAGMLDLADVLELVVDALDDRPLAQQELVGGGQNALAHVLAYLGDQRDALGGEQLLGKRLGDVAAIVDHQVQLEAVEPAHRSLAPTRIDSKDAVLRDAGVVTDREGGRVHKADAGTGGVDPPSRQRTWALAA